MDGQRLHDVGMDALTVVEVALVEAAQQHFGGGDVGRDRHTVHIAQPQQVLLAAAVLGLERVAEEEHEVYFVAGHPGRDLLDAAQLPGEVAVYGPGRWPAPASDRWVPVAMTVLRDRMPL